MGYMGLKHYIESDMASDFVMDIQDVIATLIKKQAKMKTNEYNTSGCVNVAMFNEAFILPVLRQRKAYFNLNIKSALKIAQTELVKELASANKLEKSPNKTMHLKAYNRLLSNLTESLELM